MSSKLNQIKHILKHKNIHTDGQHIFELFDNDEVVKLPINFYNTARNAGRWHNKFSNDYYSSLGIKPSFKESHRIENITTLWQLLLAEYDLVLPYEDESFDEDHPHQAKLSPLDNFMLALELGEYPPPEIMFAIFDCFKTYFDLKGQLSLEDIFFGKAQKSTGNQASRYSRNYKFVKLAIALEFREEKQTKHSVAEEVIKELNLNDNPTSLLRQYNSKVAKIKNRITK